jgi:ribosomal protein S20
MSHLSEFYFILKYKMEQKKSTDTKKSTRPNHSKPSEVKTELKTNENFIEKYQPGYVNFPFV